MKPEDWPFHGMNPPTTGPAVGPIAAYGDWHRRDTLPWWENVMAQFGLMVLLFMILFRVEA